jgi:hypothetical protein
MRALAAALLLLWVAHAHAGRPLETDDASILGSGTCQVETWVKRFRDTTDLWLLPACNPIGNLELTFGGAWTRGSDTYLSARLAQVKTSFRPLQADDWGIAATLGTTSYPRRAEGNSGAGDPYLYAAFSRSFAADAWIVHLNLGAVHERDVHEASAVWGFANEIRIAPRTQFLAEIYHLGRGQPYYQLALRHALVENRVLVDATYGDRTTSGSAGHWFSIGLHIETEPFLPWGKP